MSVVRVPLTQWIAQAQLFRHTVLSLLGGSTPHDKSHPVTNYLCEYYSFKPSQLMKWSPGLHVTLDGASLDQHSHLLRGRGFLEITHMTGEYSVSALTNLPRAVAAWERNHNLLRETSTRRPNLSCFGLHEWAMLHRPGSPPRKRHQALPLRVSQETVDSTVESIPLRCTHFDAFRHFAPSAKPLNKDQRLSRTTQHITEQPACVHANMDLFKWAWKLSPFVPSTLLLSALRISIESRVVDVLASPYDCADVEFPVFSFPAPDTPLDHCAFEIDERDFAFETLPLPPICIETPEGRAEYVDRQKELMRSAQRVRAALIGSYSDAITAGRETLHQRSEAEDTELGGEMAV